MHFTGGLEVPDTHITTTPDTLDDTDFVVFIDTATVGGITTVNLPAISTHDGQVYCLVNTGGAFVATITPNGSDTIGGAASVNLTAGSYRWYIADNTTSDWIRIV